ncbi:3-hydroxyacyl-CoA dehydrogenase family protein, partial [Gilvibacter sp.]
MIHRVGIIGAGTMGSGIAQVAATAGCEVVLCDLNQEVLDRSAAKLEQVLSRLVVKGRIESEEKKRIQALISYSTSLGDLAGSNLVIEAIVESLEIKTELFQQLEPLLGDDCIIATNTSSLS